MNLSFCLKNKLFHNSSVGFSKRVIFSPSFCRSLSSQESLNEDDEPSFLTQVNTYLDEAGRGLGDKIKPDILKIIKACNLTLEIKIPLRRETGELELLSAYRYSTMNDLI
jgi:hypothetical protein